MPSCGFLVPSDGKEETICDSKHEVNEWLAGLLHHNSETFLLYGGITMLALWGHLNCLHILICNSYKNVALFLLQSIFASFWRGNHKTSSCFCDTGYFSTAWGRVAANFARLY